MIRILAALLAFATTTNSYALVDVQIVGGQKTSKLADDDRSSGNNDELKGNSVGLGVHYHPSTFIPVGVGVFADASKSNLEFGGLATVEMNQQTAGVEMMAWLPLPIVKPFLKANYVLYGAAQQKVAFNTDIVDVAESNSKGAKLSGHSIAAGFTWSMLPTLGLVAQYSMAKEQLVHDQFVEKSTTGQETTEDADEDNKVNFEARTISLGLSFTL